jgi:RNA polymerase sigma-70 factor (ECF subfamily)
MASDPPGSAGHEQFATTQWSVVARATRGDDSCAGRALADLCGRYWFPLYAFARRKCESLHEAQDLTQAFFVELLERDVLKRADPARGRFRTFLLAAFQNFMAHHWERQRAQKRGGGKAPLSLDFVWAESRLALEPGGGDKPEREFERLWAMQVLAASLEVLEKQYESRGQASLFAVLKAFMLGEQGDATLAGAAEQLQISEGAAKVALHRLRTRYGEALRAEIGATLSDREDVEDEIRRLFAAFGS